MAWCSSEAHRWVLGTGHASTQGGLRTPCPGLPAATSPGRAGREGHLPAWTRRPQRTCRSRRARPGAAGRPCGRHPPSCPCTARTRSCLHSGEGGRGRGRGQGERGKCRLLVARSCVRSTFFICPVTVSQCFQRQAVHAPRSSQPVPETQATEHPSPTPYGHPPSSQPSAAASGSAAPGCSWYSPGGSLACRPA